jgi:syntaxin-binding protein 1
VTTNELPYIRYYVPPHSPLGPLKPHATTRPPPPPEGSSRWRTNLARGGESRAYESVEGDHLSKLLAFMVQQGLDEYKRANPDFPVRDTPHSLRFITFPPRMLI